ncbi:MAG: glucosaminidase domain-containing protein, partial [Mucinivorans sp.]
MSSAQYIDRYKSIAIDKMKNYGIPASITLAQGLLESGNGGSELAVKANNHFGIKCGKSWTGPRIYHDDDKKDDCFRKYSSVE